MEDGRDDKRGASGEGLLIDKILMSKTLHEWSVPLIVVPYPTAQIHYLAT